MEIKGYKIRPNANLQGANLRGANLRGANLQGANLQGANLRGTDLRGANLRGANLRGANLRGTDLRGVDLRGTDLWGASLQGADLWGAKHIHRLPIGDPRAYDCIAVKHENDWIIAAGCRWLSLPDARHHWGENYKGDRAIGNRYLYGLDWLEKEISK